MSEPKELTPEEVVEIERRMPTPTIDNLIATLRAAWRERDVEVEHNGELCEKLACAEAEVERLRVAVEAAREMDELQLRAALAALNDPALANPPAFGPCALSCQRAREEEA